MIKEPSNKIKDYGEQRCLNGFLRSYDAESDSVDKNAVVQDGFVRTSIPLPE